MNPFWQLFGPRAVEPTPPDDLAASSVPGLIDEAARELRADLGGRLDGLRDEVGKVGREQFRATTLLEGQGATLEELVENWREHLGQHERDADGPRELRAELEEQVRLELLKDLLPLADALSASLRAARELPARPPLKRPARPAWLGWLRGDAPRRPGRGPAFAAWLEGLLLVERRLLDLLEREGVRPISAVGQPFDPHRHLAAALERNSGAPDGTVVSEEVRGYTFRDRVMRYAEVVVARGPNPTEPAAAKPTTRQSV